ncbi:MAG TPA: PAS domain S-box protein [Pirellulales bacterium]|nr:PAS domain S-box protein [Pirellulales bacterium]
MVLTDTDHLELFQAVVGQAPDAIIFADPSGIIRMWNDAATDIFGYPRDEAIGQSLDIIIPEHLRCAHWEGFHKAIASGHTSHGSKALRTRATHRTGQQLYVTLAFSVINGKQGNAFGAMATARKADDGKP